MDVSPSCHAASRLSIVCTRYIVESRSLIPGEYEQVDQMDLVFSIKFEHNDVKYEIIIEAC